MVQNFSYSNIEEIIKSVKELIGKKVKIIDEQNFDTNKPKKKILILEIFYI